MPEAFHDLARRIDDLPDCRGRARDVDVVGHPIDRQRRIVPRIDIVDFEIAGAGDPLRRELDAQALLDFHRRRFGARDVVRRLAADEPRLDLRLDQHVALAVAHRLVLLVLDVREADPRHLSHFDAAVFQFRADVQPLHRFVEIRFDCHPLLEESARADHHQNEDPGDDRADDEQAELEIIGPLAQLTTPAALSLRQRIRSLAMRRSLRLPRYLLHATA